MVYVYLKKKTTNSTQVHIDLWYTCSYLMLYSSLVVN